MDKQKALEYITDISWRESRLGLTRMDKLMERLGNPQRRLKFIHVAGTNGKGSVSVMLSGILSAAGYKTGLYTSPFIQSFNERFQINGCQIQDEELVGITEEVKGHADKMDDHPTEFELITAIGFVYFYRSGCDIVVLEVGLGGRLDATNIIPVPEVAVITAIGLDHVAELGDTVEKISAEKGGIIKPGGDVALYPQEENIRAVFEEICLSRGARLTNVTLDGLLAREGSIDGQSFDYKNLYGLTIPLLGTYQLNNAATVITVAEILRRKGWSISGEAIRGGLAGVKWPARFEIIRRNPAFIVDGGHNPQCAQAIVQNLQQYFPGKKIIFLVGVMADKDYGQMCRMILPFAKKVITVTPDNPRALPAAELAGYFVSLQFEPVVVCGSVAQGIDEALETAGKEDVICAFGSFYMSGTIRSYLNRT